MSSMATAVQTIAENDKERAKKRDELALNAEARAATDARGARMMLVAAEMQNLGDKDDARNVLQQVLALK